MLNIKIYSIYLLHNSEENDLKTIAMNKHLKRIKVLSEPQLQISLQLTKFH